MMVDDVTRLYNRDAVMGQTGQLFASLLRIHSQQRKFACLHRICLKFEVHQVILIHGQPVHLFYAGCFSALVQAGSKYLL